MQTSYLCLALVAPSIPDRPMKKTTDKTTPQELHLHEHNAPTYNINIGYVDKMINGEYHEYNYGDGKTVTEEKDGPSDSRKQVSGRKKVLFCKNNNQYEEDIEAKKKEAQRLKDFLKAHKLSGNKLNTQQKDTLNKYIVEFLRRWQTNKLVGEKIPGTAVFRFLTEDVGLGKDVEEVAYGSKITKMVANLEVSVETQKKVKEAFK